MIPGIPPRVFPTRTVPPPPPPEVVERHSATPIVVQIEGITYYIVEGMVASALEPKIIMIGKLAPGKETFSSLSELVPFNAEDLALAAGNEWVYAGPQ
jgi:hypothetical protein